jgi:hypothetical protein
MTHVEQVALMMEVLRWRLQLHGRRRIPYPNQSTQDLLSVSPSVSLFQSKDEPEGSEG